MVAMLVVNTKETFLLNLHQIRVHFPAERNAFVLDPQHGRCDVTCKPAIQGSYKLGMQYLHAEIWVFGTSICLLTTNLGYKVY